MPKKLFTKQDAREAQYFTRLGLKCSRHLTADQITEAWRKALMNVKNDQDAIFINEAKRDLIDEEIRGDYIDALVKYNIQDNVVIESSIN